LVTGFLFIGAAAQAGPGYNLQNLECDRLQPFWMARSGVAVPGGVVARGPDAWAL
jgi:hypothetical protein